MKNVICLRHPKYLPTASPLLSCKTCCSLFLAELKRQNAEKAGSAQDPEAWLDEKRKQAQTNAPARAGFDPQSI